MTHPLAYVHPGSKIAEDVVIEPFAVIQDNVEIGAGTRIGSHATLMKGTRIGKNVNVFPGCVISAIPRSKRCNRENSVVEIGDGTILREFVTVYKGTAARMKTKIGKDCWIMAYCHIAHDCMVGNNCTFSNYTSIESCVDVGDYVTLGPFVRIHRRCSLGDHTFLATGSCAEQDVPPYIKAARLPLSYAGVDYIGLKRVGFSIEKIREIQSIYRLIYQKGSSTSKATKIIESEMDKTPEREKILEFIRNSKRGIVHGCSSGSMKGLFA